MVLSSASVCHTPSSIFAHSFPPLFRPASSLSAPRSGYYFWASVAPKQDPTKKPRWNQPAFYKKYITTFQLFQFCLNFAQASYMLFVNPPADFAIFTVWILFFYMITMLALFGNFFMKTYTAKGKNGKVAGANPNAKKEL